MLSCTTHATLLDQISAGDPTAWQVFHDRYGEMIRGFAQRRGRQAADCDDIVQDVFLALTQTMPKFSYDRTKGKFRGYLKTLVVHEIYQKTRLTKRRNELEDMGVLSEMAASDEEADEAWETEWRAYHMRLALRQIEREFAEKDVQAFRQYAIAGRDVRETAETLGITTHQVYKAKTRMLKRLGLIIEKQIQEEG